MKNHPRLFHFCILVIVCAVLAGCDAPSQENPVTSSYQGNKVSTEDCNYGGEIKSVEALDEYTVQFTLCKPDSAFPAKMTSPVLAIQDSDYLAIIKGDSAKISRAPIGTGPYVFKEWNSNGVIALTPSEKYWGVPPITQRIEFSWQPDQSRRFTEYDFSKNEGMDFPSIAMTKPFVFLDAIYDNPELHVVAHEPLNLYYLGFNNTIAPFNNAAIRKAIAVALDRQDLIDFSFPAGTELAQQIVPSAVTPGRSMSLKWHETNSEAAKKILEDAGYDFNQKITLAFINAPMQILYSPSALASEIRLQLEKIGVKVEIKPMSQEQFEQSLKDGKEMFYIYWYMADYPDGLAFFEKPFISQSAYLGEPYTDIQKKIYDIRSKDTDDEQQAVYDQLNELVLEQVPLIPIGHSSDLTVFRSTIKNVTANAYFENLEDVVSDENIIRFIGGSVPASIWPADEDDFSTFRITRLIYDTLLAQGFGDMEFKPLLAESWESNSDLTQWTFHLRYNVKFSNGSNFDANDVVASFAALWDASSPNHTGRTGDFAVFKRLFGNMINE